MFSFLKDTNFRHLIAWYWCLQSNYTLRSSRSLLRNRLMRLCIILEHSKHFWVRIIFRFLDIYPCKNETNRERGSVFPLYRDIFRGYQGCKHCSFCPGIPKFLWESGRSSGRKHYLHHRCSPGLSSHWQPHKACPETDDSATKTTQVAGCRPPGAEKLGHTKISGRHHKRGERLKMGEAEWGNCKENDGCGASER